MHRPSYLSGQVQHVRVADKNVNKASVMLLSTSAPLVFHFSLPDVVALLFQVAVEVSIDGTFENHPAGAVGATEC